MRLNQVQKQEDLAILDVAMPVFSKATLILNAPYLQNDMKVCRFTLADVLLTINQSENPKGGTVGPFKYFRRKWGQQKIRVTYAVCKSMEGKEYAVVTDVLSDVPPDARKK